MDISSSASTQYGAALLTASLAKQQQTQEGETVLKLIQSAAPSASATSATATLGSNINIHV